jgi:2-hydroxychromene-2-carboxylate isomerase
MARVSFYFDLSSPYSYLAATQLAGLAARTGAEVAWRPMFLAAVFKAVGATMADSSVAKRRWQRRDLGHWAERYGVPWKMATRFPQNTVQAMRLILVDDARAAAVALAGFAAMWVDDRDLSDPDVLRAIATAGGLDPDAALAAIQTPAIKDRLRANTDEAIAHGAFGAPAFVVGDELFWGNDRLSFVEAALLQRRPV